MAQTSKDNVEVKRVLLTLDEETVEVFRRLGGGNVSLGARMAARPHHAGAATQTTLPSGGGRGAGSAGGRGGPRAVNLRSARR